MNAVRMHCSFTLPLWRSLLSFALLRFSFFSDLSCLAMIWSSSSSEDHTP